MDLFPDSLPCGLQTLTPRTPGRIEVANNCMRRVPKLQADLRCSSVSAWCTTEDCYSSSFAINIDQADEHLGPFASMVEL